MVSVNELANELKANVEFQQTPRVISDNEYISMIAYGIRRLYIDTGRADQFPNDGYITEGEAPNETIYFNADLGIDEIEYVLIMAQMRFFDIVRASVNTMVSYSTDALSVTQGDKPYANITGTLNELEKERRIVYYKMVPYTISSDV